MAERASIQAPGPEGELLLGRLSRFRRDPLRMLVELQREYGEIVRVRLGPHLVHQVTDPAAIRHVLHERDPDFRRGRFYSRFRLFFGRGMLTTDREAWHRRRHESQPFFHRPRLEAGAPVVVERTATMLDRWSRLAARGEAFDLVPELMALSLAVLGRMLLGVDLSDDMDRIGPAVRFSLKAMILTGELDQMLPAWLPTRYNRTLRRSKRVLDETIERVVGEHRAGGCPAPDLASTLLAARDPETGEPWSAREVHDELMTIFLAGHETTGCGLAWTLYAIAEHPEVRERLEDELARELGGRVPAAADLARLPYLCRVVDESLRLYPPIWLFPRDANADTELAGCHVPANTSILLTPYASHRNPAYWDDPDAFDPDRFLPERSAGRPRYAYLPFGGGRRQCIGYYLALLELRLVVAMVVQRFRVRAVPGHPVVCGPLVSLRPLHGIRVTLEEVQQP
jgi:cytochrome P450